MAVLVDLKSSRNWAEPEVALPTWLNADWVIEHNAYIVCALDSADDVTSLRDRLGNTARLICYPNSELLREHLSPQELLALKRLFMDSLGASTYIEVSRNTESTPEPVTLPDLDTGSAEARPSLALVSPLPPCPSGIAIYCDEVIPALDRYYQITLVVEDCANIDRNLASRYEVISHGDLMISGQRFDRIMYHFGNSSLHYDYFMLIKAHPGIAILHDIYLGDGLYSNHRIMHETELRQAIYQSHGWPALLDCEVSARQSIGIYPACGSAFSDAYGVIVHNRYAVDLLSLYFDKQCLQRLSSTVLARKIKQLPDRDATRAALGIAADESVFASFGLFNRNKCFEELMQAWVASGLSNNGRARLIFAGGCSDTELEKDVREWQNKLPHPGQIELTGYIDIEVYDQYLAAADVAIQLRKSSRGEMSAALLDCMAAGLPTIVNAHGSMAEVPENTVFFVPDTFTTDELSAALAAAVDKTSERLHRGQLAREYVSNHHSPEKVAAAYSEIMEAGYRTDISVKTNKLRSAFFSPRLSTLPDHEIWPLLEQFDDIARCAGALRRSIPGKQLLFDVSSLIAGISHYDAPDFWSTLLKALLANAGIEWRIEPVYFDPETQKFRYARKFTSNLLQLSSLRLFDDTVEVYKGDAYLTPDTGYDAPHTSAQLEQLKIWLGRAAEVISVIDGAAAVKKPEPGDQSGAGHSRINGLTELCSGIICTSKALADSLHSSGCAAGCKIGYLETAAEQVSSLAQGSSCGSEKSLQALIDEPALLLVEDTQHPEETRSILEAFTLLWASGVDLPLLYVKTDAGRKEELYCLDESGDTKGKILKEISTASDVLIRFLCQKSAGVIIHTMGEATLPLIAYASGAGTPLIVRDTAELRAACEDDAWYFRGSDSAAISSQMAQWFSLLQKGEQQSSEGMHWMQWKWNAEQVLNCIAHDKWTLG